MSDEQGSALARKTARGKKARWASSVCSSLVLLVALGLEARIGGVRLSPCKLLVFVAACVVVAVVMVATVAR